MRSLQWITTVVVTLLCLGAFAGCGPTAQAPAPENPMLEERGGESLALERERAIEAKRIALEHPGVEVAFSVLSAPATMLVGVLVEEGANPKDVEELLEQISARIRDEVDGVMRVLITADPELTRGIRDVEEGISEGRSSSDYAAEINELASQIAPSVDLDDGQDSR